MAGARVLLGVHAVKPGRVGGSCIGKLRHAARARQGFQREPGDGNGKIRRILESIVDAGLTQELDLKVRGAAGQAGREHRREQRFNLDQHIGADTRQIVGIECGQSDEVVPRTCP